MTLITVNEFNILEAITIFESPKSKLILINIHRSDKYQAVQQIRGHVINGSTIPGFSCTIIEIVEPHKHQMESRNPETQWIFAIQFFDQPRGR
jgi:hypothetical protein